MSSLWLDVEVLADREADVQTLAAQLAGETEQDEPQQDDGLPPIIQDEVPNNGTDEQRDNSPSESTKPKSFTESRHRFLRTLVEKDDDD